jgi:RNA polymerase sigma-70 factor (ECF subfamily)
VVRKKGEASLEEEPQAAETPSEEPTPLARHEMTDQLRRLLACLGDLEEERRRLVLLAYYSGWSREQLAEKFETPVNTVKTWLRRSLLQIRECLGS